MTHNLNKYPGTNLIKTVFNKLNLKYTLSEPDVDSLLCCVWSANGESGPRLSFSNVPHIKLI